MENRIDRKGDESLYQPKIHSNRIRTLYKLKQETGKPMTVLLDRAIHDLAERYNLGRQFEEEPVYQEVTPQIWEEICELRKLLDQQDYLRRLDEIGEIQRHE